MTTWRKRLNALARFMSTSDRWPSYRTYTDSTERQLGIWLHAQRQNALDGRMPNEMAAGMNAAVPGWNTWKRKAEQQDRESTKLFLTPPLPWVAVHPDTRSAPVAQLLRKAAQQC